MKAIRSKRPLLFDSLVLVAFVLFGFAAFGLADLASVTGAAAALVLLGLTCVVLMFSR